MWSKVIIHFSIINSPFVFTGDPHATIDGISLSYDPVYGIDNKAALEFVWECETFDTKNIEELVNVSAQSLPANPSSNCDDISTEKETGKRQLQVADSIDAAGYLFKVGTI